MRLAPLFYPCLLSACLFVRGGVGFKEPAAEAAGYQQLRQASSWRNLSEIDKTSDTETSNHASHNHATCLGWVERFTEMAFKRGHDGTAKAYRKRTQGWFAWPRGITTHSNR